MLQYDNEAIIEICSNFDLLEYASQSMDFEKRSDNYFTNCPKHIDLTPSLSINPNNNLFYCFSCGRNGNIINWLIEFEDLSFLKALKKLIELSDITDEEQLKLKQPNAVLLFKQIKRLGENINNKEIHREILDKSILNNYSKELPEEWIEEGINPLIMKKYNIRIDKENNRIIYPVYDKNFNLIGIKGRTRYKDYKKRGLMKYQNYQKIGTTDFFAGMKENIENIKKTNEVIIFEGIKSGMKVEEWGYNNWLSSETSYLNEEQSIILLEMKVKNIVMAYDNDVDLNKIKECTKLIRKYTNVFTIYDKKKLLGNRESKLSPVDLGRDIWEILYTERVKLY